MKAAQLSGKTLGVMKNKLPVVISLIPFVALTYGLLNTWVLAGTPFYPGIHREFFRSCKQLPLGATPPIVLRKMQRHVVAQGDRGISDARLGTQQPTAHSGARKYHAESTFLLYPNRKDTADWCICYFHENHLVRTIVDPD